MKVVNVRRRRSNAPGIVYCGRRTYNGWRKSPLYNPYRLDKDGNRAQVIAKYRAYLLREIEKGNRAILDALDALTEDSVLGCWCKPLACHCDVIVEVWRMRKGN
jgi:hypothetical protein